VTTRSPNGRLLLSRSAGAPPTTSPRISAGSFPDKREGPVLQVLAAPGGTLANTHGQVRTFV
jgi:hypothetical protein